ncbi:Na(+)/H(+) antiporter subunit D [Parvularcula sp. ZS-1/3]|uniref:Na(+)/H(+) antiporter subunit D n=1 Tax=Parvularcula mediterranea TaxID=2732508 RepID=A0A7Y3RM40_9PROT|nr:Na(+)/H(+) antiporter subunit D [Parvularcula mediterranea]NNU16621.1 Na(+)/H(+) antiporter subunit D [Parvularcula mediterranea]
MIPFIPADTNPAMIMMVAGALMVFFGHQGRGIIGLIAVVLSGWQLFNLGVGPMGDAQVYGTGEILGYEFMPLRLDKLSVIFAIVFHSAAFLNVIYGWQSATKVEASMGIVYAGSAVGGALAGDLLTLFIFWEIAALSSVFIVWAGGGHAAFKAGMRYLVIQVMSGLLLFAGIVLHLARGGSSEFGAFELVGEAGVDPVAALILFAFGIKACFPLLHTWLQDSYPKASGVGAVMLSAFTTKLAIYTLARGFAGTDILIPIGVVMTAFPVFFALIENDLRKVLSYSLNNQLGFMVCAIGIGTELAINGAAAHAFVHITYKALLFMGMGAVMQQAGTARATELGGLHKSMPWTTAFTIVGAMSISAFPLFSGFVAKSMITVAAGEEHLLLVYIMLLFASAGVLEHSGIKIPYFAFFAHDRFAPSLRNGVPRPKEAPLSMLIAMGIAAFLCLLVGFYPPILYGLLPYETDYHAYTAEHVATQMQLLLFAIFAFMLLVKFKLYPAEVRSQNLDVDWFWRVPGRKALMATVAGVASVWHTVWGGLKGLSGSVVSSLGTLHGPGGVLSRYWTVGFTALFTAAVLAVVLITAFLN